MKTSSYLVSLLALSFLTSMAIFTKQIELVYLAIGFIILNGFDQICERLGKKS